MTQTSPIAIDLSHHNTVSSFTSVAADDVIAVVHKATEGTTYVDDKYAERRKAALAAGLTFCSYHFLKHGSVEQQIAHYLKTAKPEPGERVVIDHEDAAVTLADLEAAVRAVMASDPSLQITVYSGHTIKEQLGSARNALLAENTSLWLSQYTTGTPSWPTGTWPAWTLWQYSDKGSVAGISGACDVNRFNGSDDNAAKWFGPLGQSPAGAKQPAPGQPDQKSPILVDIMCPPGANIVITINGNVITPG